jgi:hypothetical protein
MKLFIVVTHCTAALRAVGLSFLFFSTSSFSFFFQHLLLLLQGFF